MSTSVNPGPGPGKPFAHIRAKASDGRQFVLKVDVTDFDRLSAYSWTLDYDGNARYAYTVQGGYSSGKRRTIRMSHLVLGEPPNRHARVDHINGDTLDCRRANLRWATQSQILAKRRPVGGVSAYKGVAWDRHVSKWMARFRGKNLGRFKKEEDAAMAFDDAAYAYWGAGCYLNFPDRFPAPGADGDQGGEVAGETAGDQPISEPRRQP